MLDFVQSIELGARIEGHVTSLVRHRLNGRVIQITGALLRRHLQLRLRLRWGSECAGAQQYQSKQNLQHFTHPNTHTHSGLYTGQLNWALIVLLLVAVKKNYRKKWAKVLRSFHSLSVSVCLSGSLADRIFSVLSARCAIDLKSVLCASPVAANGFYTGRSYRRSALDKANSLDWTISRQSLYGTTIGCVLSGIRLFGYTRVNVYICWANCQLFAQAL